MKVEEYLEIIQNQESIFPMDSLHTGRGPLVKKSENLEDDENEKTEQKGNRLKNL